MNKLKKLGIVGTPLGWIKSYLQNQPQVTCIIPSQNTVVQQMSTPMMIVMACLSATMDGACHFFLYVLFSFSFSLSLPYNSQSQITQSFAFINESKWLMRLLLLYSRPLT